MDTPNFIIKGSTLVAVADYLMTKPYNEVSGLLEAMKSDTAPIMPAAETEEDTDAASESTED